jgi:hypothetical protein
MLPDLLFVYFVFEQALTNFAQADLEPLNLLPSPLKLLGSQVWYTTPCKLIPFDSHGPCSGGKGRSQGHPFADSASSNVSYLGL